jgi:alpha-1,2-mannosyltransferase
VAGCDNDFVTVTSQTNRVRDWASLNVRELPPRTRTRVVVAAIVLVGVATAVAYAIYTRYGPHHSQYDLKIYYNATSFWISGNSLYDYWQPDPVNGTLGFTYPTAAALLMVPMHAFGLSTVVAINFLGILAAGFGCMWLWLRNRLPLGRLQLLTAILLLTAAAFCFQPFAQTVAFGQINLYLALLVTVDVLVLANRGSRWTGVLVGISMAVKLTPGIFLVYFLLRKDWRSVVVAGCSCAGVTLLSAVVAPGQTWLYFTKLLWQSDRVGLVDNTTNQSINGLLARLSPDGIPNTLTWALLSLVAVLAALPRIRAAIVAGNTLTALVLTGLLGLLVSPVTWIHHAVWFVPAFYLLAEFLWHSRPSVFTGVPRLAFPSRAAGRTWLLALLLVAVGAWIWFKDTRVVFGLPDTGYAGLSMVAQVEGSVQMLWMIAALFLLPVRTPQARVESLTESSWSLGPRVLR